MAKGPGRRHSQTTHAAKLHYCQPATQQITQLTQFELPEFSCAEEKQQTAIKLNQVKL